MDPPAIYMDMLRMCIRSDCRGWSHGVALPPSRVVYVPTPSGMHRRGDLIGWSKALVRRVCTEVGAERVPRVKVEVMEDGGVRGGLRLTLYHVRSSLRPGEAVPLDHLIAPDGPGA